ncbi:MAG: type IV pilus assembly protein PilM [Firmicutes bacterium]|nr:type IV pilus assembly protein PilM [Bacillota bacterium]
MASTVVGEPGAAPTYELKGRYSSIGIDLGSSQIKLMQLRQERGRIILNQCGIYHLPDGAIVDGRIIDEALLADHLGKILQQRRFHRNRVNLCISNQAVILRQMELPKMAPREIPAALRFQAEKEIMIPLDQAVVDYIEMGERFSDGKATLDLAVVAVPKDVVNGYLNVITGAGLVPESIEIEPLALRRVFPYITAVTGEPEGGLQIILDLGGESSTIIFLDNGAFSFARTLSIGVNHLCRRIAEEEASNFESAHSLLFGSDPFSVKGMQGVADELVSQVRRSLDFYSYNVVSASKDIETIYFCGGGASIEQLPAFLGFELKVEPKLIQPFSFIESDRRFIKKDLDREGHLLNVAAGLALRGWRR